MAVRRLLLLALKQQHWNEVVAEFVQIMNRTLGKTRN